MTIDTYFFKPRLVGRQVLAERVCDGCLVPVREADLKLIPLSYQGRHLYTSNGYHDLKEVIEALEVRDTLFGEGDGRGL